MRPIPSCPGYYATWGGEICRNGRAITIRSNGHGYLQVTVSIAGRRSTKYVHRLVCEAYHGPAPEGHECRHLDGSRNNNSGVNLCWSTKAENEADKIGHGTLRRGDSHGAAKLTEEGVLEARRRVRAGESIDVVAKSMGHRRALLADAIMGRRWGHLPGALEPYSTRRKFSPEEVREIRERGESEMRTELAKEFGVTENAIRQILSGKSYSHVVRFPCVTPQGK